MGSRAGGFARFGRWGECKSQAGGYRERWALNPYTREREVCVREVRGWGLILGMELTEECGFLAGDVVGKLTEAGMLTVPAGLRVVRFVPPLVVTAQEVDEALALIGDTLKSLKK